MSEAHDGVKRCSRCRRVKKVELFYANKHNKDKLSAECKDCRRIMEKPRLEVDAVNTGKPFTTKELELIARTDLTILEMARRLGRTYSAIANARQKYGLAGSQGPERYKHIEIQAQMAMLDWFGSHGAPSTLLYRARQHFGIPHQDTPWFDQAGDPRSTGKGAI